MLELSHMDIVHENPAYPVKRRKVALLEADQTRLFKKHNAQHVEGGHEEADKTRPNIDHDYVLYAENRNRDINASRVMLVYALAETVRGTVFCNIIR